MAARINYSYLIRVTENGGLAQLGEHLPCKQGVESSNLLISIGFLKSNLFKSNEH